VPLIFVSTNKKIIFQIVNYIYVVKYIITITIFEGEKNPSKFDWIQSINNFLVKFVTVGFK
jgi:hypothetical protein